MGTRCCEVNIVWSRRKRLVAGNLSITIGCEKIAEKLKKGVPVGIVLGACT